VFTQPTSANAASDGLCLTLLLIEQEFNELREFGRRAAANEDLRIESKYKIIALDPGLSAEERKQQRTSCLLITIQKSSFFRRSLASFN
jgi:hypothetical protein